VGCILSPLCGWTAIASFDHLFFDHFLLGAVSPFFRQNQSLNRGVR
jgi:hypothetical protein